jgi:hypothetical protein
MWSSPWMLLNSRQPSSKTMMALVKPRRPWKSPLGKIEPAVQRVRFALRVLQPSQTGTHEASQLGLGRPPRQIDPARLATVAGLPEREAARRLGVPRSTLQRFRALNAPR